MAKQFLDDVSLVDVGQAFVSAVVGEVESFVIEAELVQDRGMEVGGLGAVRDGSIAEVVGGSRFRGRRATLV